MAARAACARSTVRAIETGSLSGRIGDLARIWWVRDVKGLRRILAGAAFAAIRVLAARQHH